MKNKNKNYQTVGTVLKYHTVGTVLKYHTVGTVIKYHTVGTVLKYHPVGTVLKSNRTITEMEIKSIFLTNIYMNGQLHGLIQALD